MHFIFLWLAVVFITADTEVPDLLKTKANPKKIQPLRQHSLLDLGKKKIPKSKATYSKSQSVNNRATLY